MPSTIISLYFGKVSSLLVRAFVATSGAYEIFDAYISWIFVLSQALVLDFSMARVCVTSC